MDPVLLLTLVAFGLMTGVLAGLLGVGGGIFTVPFLVLAVGLTQQVAQATSLLVVLPTALVATWSLRRRGAVDLGLALRMGVAGIAGSVVGALLALELPAEVVRLLFAALLLLVGARLIRDAIRSPQPGKPRPS